MVSLIAVLIAVVYAAVSQGNGPAYLPAYALISLLLISWLHNHFNVQQVELTAHREANGFAGAVLLLPFKLRNKNNRPRFGLQLTSSLGGTVAVGKLESEVEGTISIPGLKRGVYTVDYLEVASVFPMGVFRSWLRQAVSCVCHVYPQPLGELEAPLMHGIGEPDKKGQRIAGDDFAGVRNYMAGESQRHIDWKAVARGQPLMVKQFESISQKEIWLDEAPLRKLDLEAQLSQMARWVMQCERAGLRYGMKIGQTRVQPGQGNTHYHRCLQELAAIPAAPRRVGP
jgi:uncharacterized protein (DUF58 family)